MKALKGKTLMSLIYTMCLSIPLVSILSRVIYVQSNKNAYQSYSGQNEQSIEVINTNVEDLETNKTYIFSNLSYTDTNTGFRTTNYSIAYLKIDDVEYTQYQFMRFYRGSDSNMSLCFYLPNSTTINLEVRSNQNKRVELIFSNINNYNTQLYYDDYNAFNVYIYNNNASLDNVFDYSVNQLVSENNFGQLNFFSWFGNMLLTDAQQNMLYVRFVNWYLNYALLVSLMQILFLCLMWFVNFSRKLLDRGMNYDW